MAEWLRTGLQIRLRRFDSGSGLQLLGFCTKACPNLTLGQGLIALYQSPSQAWTYDVRGLLALQEAHLDLKDALLILAQVA